MNQLARLKKTVKRTGKNAIKKVTILIGRPRKHGSTRILAEEAERGLREQGIETEFIFLNDLKFRGCQACYYYKKNDVTACAVLDDMQKIYPLMQESAGLIVGTPVYFGGVTAQTKTWLDRLFPYIGMNLSPNLQKSKKVSFILTQKQPDVHLFEKPITRFMHMVALTGFSQKRLSDCVRPRCRGKSMRNGQKGVYGEGIPDRKRPPHMILSLNSYNHQ